MFCVTIFEDEGVMEETVGESIIRPDKVARMFSMREVGHERLGLQ